MQKIKILSFVTALIMMSPVFAAAQTFKIVSSPRIFSDKVTIESFNDKTGVVSGFFIVNNQEDRSFYDLVYEISLYKIVLKKSVNPEEKNIFDSNNQKWIPVSTAIYPNEFPVDAKGSKRQDFEFKLPENRPEGTMFLKVQMYQKNGSMLGSAISSFMEVKPAGIFIETTESGVIKDGKNYDPLVGINTEPDKQLEAFFVAFNPGRQKADAVVKINCYERDIFGTESAEISDAARGEVLPNEYKRIPFMLPKIEKPGSYLAVARLVNSSDSKDISAPVHFRYVVSGESASILDLSSEKKSYSSGDTMQVKIKAIGSADSVLVGEDQSVFENESRTSFPADIKVTVFDRKNKISGEATSQAVLSAEAIEVNVPVVLDRKLSGEYSVKADITKKGKILDSKQVSVVLEKRASLGDVILYLVLIAFVLAVAGFSFLYLKKKKPLKVGLFFVFAFLIFGFANANKALAWDINLNWTSPPPDSHYNARSQESDMVSFQATPALYACSNYIHNLSQGRTGFYVNGQMTSLGLAGTSMPAGVYLIGPNNVEVRVGVCDRGIVIEDGRCLLNAAPITACEVVSGCNGGFFLVSESRTFYLDSGVAMVLVGEQTSNGIRNIGGASVTCGGQSGTTASNGQVDIGMLRGNITCTASAPGYSSNSVNVSYNVGDPGRRIVRINLTRIANNRPTGTFDSASCSAGSVTVSGTARDPDSPNASIPIHVYKVGGTWVGACNTNGSTGQYSCSFSNNIVVGNNEIHIYAVDANDNSVSSFLGARNVNCPGAPVVTNPPACTDNTWTPPASDVCAGQSFQQTSNCNNSRTSIGTKSCPQGVCFLFACVSANPWFGSIPCSTPADCGFPPPPPPPPPGTPSVCYGASCAPWGSFAPEPGMMYRSCSSHAECNVPPPPPPPPPVVPPAPSVSHVCNSDGTVTINWRTSTPGFVTFSHRVDHNHHSWSYTHCSQVVAPDRCVDNDSRTSVTFPVDLGVPYAFWVHEMYAGSNYGPAGSVSFTCNAAPPPPPPPTPNIVVCPDSASLSVGETRQFSAYYSANGSASCSPASGTNVTNSSSWGILPNGTNFASVNNSGLVTAVRSNETVLPSGARVYAPTSVSATYSGISDSSELRISGRTPDCTLTANPSNINLPQTSVLNWDCNQNADSCTIDNGIGQVCNSSASCNAGGTINVSPSSTTAYSMNCSCLNCDSSLTSTTTITVGGGGRTEIIEVLPTIIRTLGNLFKDFFLE